MYDDHYGLSGKPFQLTPDPRFWFDTATHKKAMAYLGYGLAQGEGFIVITGDVGAGKTTLVGHLMATIDRERLHLIQLVSTQIEADDLLRMVAGGFAIDSGGMTKAQLLTAIERALHATARGGKRTLLIIDEAQALPVSALEELRMLSNFQAGGHALLQIFLLGQPEFRERLHGSDRLEQLRQRVIAIHHLDPMGPEEVEPYMAHRLSVVGWNGRPDFTDSAIAALYAGSDGVPRRLNQLAGRVMLHGAVEGIDVIDGAAIEAVIADIAGDSPVAQRAAERAAEPIAPVAAPDARNAEGTPRPFAPLSRAAPPPPSPDGTGPRPIILTPPPAPPAASEPRATAPETLAPAGPVDGPVAGADASRAASRDTAPHEEEATVPANDAESAERATRADDPASGASPAPADPVLIARIAALEARVEDQDAALRRVLTLLVDWVEGEQRPDLAAVRAATG